MKQWQSSTWAFFGSRPTTILQRQFRKEWYFGVKDVSRLAIGGLIAIADEGSFKIYLKRSDESRNNRMCLQDYRTRLADRLLTRWQRWLKMKKVPGKNPGERAFYAHHHLGSTLLYSHYLERVLTRDVQRVRRLSSASQDRLERLISRNSAYRDAMVRRQDQYYQRALKWYQRRYTGIRNIRWHMPKELEAGFFITAAQARERQRFSVQISVPGQTQLSTGSAARRLLKKEGFRTVTVSAAHQVKGLPAQPGQAAGKAVVVRTPHDLKKITKGCIVISPMTIAQYTPYLKTAAALVTDEGGINCHAAVTAREFSVPCIVGTRNASAVFKTGDPLVVDADAGTVNKKT